MKRALETTLTRCLARLEAGDSVGDILRDEEALAGELRPLLQAASALRGETGRIPEHTTAGLQRGRSRMRAARARQGQARAPWAGLFGRPASLLAVAAVVAVLAALGFTADLFRFGAGTTSAHVDGVVARVDADAIILMTDDGEVIIRMGEQTVVLDANGKAISGGEIAPGVKARVEVDEEDGALSAERIEVEDEEEDGAQGPASEVEFSGVVQTLAGSSLTVGASFGTATVHVDSHTEVKGDLGPGVAVKVHATLQADGSYLAREIEVGPDDGGGDGASDDGGDDGSGSGNSGSGSSGSGSEEDDSSNSGSGSSGGGSDDDTHDSEEHD